MPITQAQPAAKITATFAGTSFILYDVTTSGLTAGTIDNTDQSVTDGYRTHEFNGFIEPGEATLKVAFDGTLPTVGTTGALVVTYPTPISKVHTYSNTIFMDYSDTAVMGQVMTATVKFKLSGKPAVTAAT